MHVHVLLFHMQNALHVSPFGIVRTELQLAQLLF